MSAPNLDPAKYRFRDYKKEYIYLENDPNPFFFYTSPCGSVYGLSRNIVAKLCGVEERAIFSKYRFGWYLARKENPFYQYKIPHFLRKYWGKLYVFNDRESNFNLVCPEAAAAIIQYYGFIHRHPREKAKESFRKFSQVGLVNWLESEAGLDRGVRVDMAAQSLDKMLEFVKQRQVRQDLKVDEYLSEF